MTHRVRWAGGSRFWAETETGHAVPMMGLPEGDESNVAPRPMELLIAGLGGCTSYDVVAILRKARQQVTECVVEIEAARAEDIPKVYTRIALHYIVTGHGVKESQVKRAVELSAEKYCSASLMLGKTAEITHTWEVREATAATEAEAL
jgi:putative redox protein